jgi:hypothetical protein
MKFKIYNEFGALNSVPVFAALEQGIKNLGHSVVNRDPDVEVIWSVLWHGRMKSNKMIYDRARHQKKPIMIIEVGNLIRGVTWRLSLDHINGLGRFGNNENLDISRPSKLGINLKPPKQNRQPAILIACQHEHSLQWEGQPCMSEWARLKIQEIRKYTDRPIVVRPHPRSPFHLSMAGITIQQPTKLPNTYDDYNFNTDYHCVVNHNSGPPIHAAINGIPVITDESSLAYPVSDLIENIENPQLGQRDLWLLKLAHTEWTVDEIATGAPLERLINLLTC